MSQHLVPASLPLQAVSGLLEVCAHPTPTSPQPLSGLRPREKGSAFQKAVDLAVPTSLILISPGKINSSNMSALKWRYSELLPALGTQGLQPLWPLVRH